TSVHITPRIQRVESARPLNSFQKFAKNFQEVCVKLLRKTFSFSFTKVLLRVGAVAMIMSASYAQTALTNDAVVKMVKAGLAEDFVINMIASQPAQFMVTPDALIELKTAGVSDKIIAAMVGKGSQPNAAAKANSAPANAAPAADQTANLDIGVYFKKKDEW